MSLRDQLSGIYTQHGLLTPQLVVDVARPADHPLHDRFDWNDTTAGEAWRRHQAAGLIRSVRLTYREATETEPERTVRAFHSVATPDGKAYLPAEQIAHDPMARQILLREMERAWHDMKRRYAEFDEFWRLVRTDAEEPAA